MNREVEIHRESKRYEIIDFMKGFSIITIVLMHLLQGCMTRMPDLLKTASSLGGTGVHVFFFCSGLGLSISQMHEPLKYTQFIKRRFVKVYIPYIVIVLISACLPFMYDGSHRLVAVASHVFLFKLCKAQYMETFGPFWFMSALMVFYLLFIVLTKLRQRVGNRVFLTGSLLASISWWVAVAVMQLEAERVLSGFFLQYLWEFSLGMVVADYLEKGNTIKLKVRILCMIAITGIGLQAGLAFGGGVFRLFNDIPALFGYGALAVLIYATGWSWLKQAVLKISSISYELYLVHSLVFSCTYLFCPESLGLQVLTGAAALGLSYIAATGYKLILTKLLRSRQLFASHSCEDT